MADKMTNIWQYSIATILIISGVVIAFFSFFLNHHDIEGGVLTYIAQAFITGGAIMGVNVCINRNNSKIMQYVDDKLKQKEQRG